MPLTLPRCCVASYGGVADEGDKESNSHAACSISYISHQYWSNRTSHDCHDEQGGSKLGLCSRISQCQREDGGKHNALSQIQGEERNEG